MTTASLLGMDPSRSRLDIKVDSFSGDADVQFPSMSRLLKDCGEGCQWAYVVKLENLKSVAIV